MKIIFNVYQWAVTLFVIVLIACCAEANNPALCWTVIMLNDSGNS